MAAAGLRCDALIGIEGPAWLSAWAGDHWVEEVMRERLLDLLRAVEAKPDVLSVSAHLLAVGRKDADG